MQSWIMLFLIIITFGAITGWLKAGIRYKHLKEEYEYIRAAHDNKRKAYDNVIADFRTLQNAYNVYDTIIKNIKDHNMIIMQYKNENGKMKGCKRITLRQLTYNDF